MNRKKELPISKGAAWVPPVCFYIALKSDASGDTSTDFYPFYNDVGIKKISFPQLGKKAFSS